MPRLPTASFIELSKHPVYGAIVANRSISQLDTTDVAVEYEALAAQLDVSLTAERRAQAILVVVIAKAETEGERQRRALSR